MTDPDEAANGAEPELDDEALTDVAGGYVPPPKPNPV